MQVNKLHTNYFPLITFLVKIIKSTEKIKLKQAV